MLLFVENRRIFVERGGRRWGWLLHNAANTGNPDQHHQRKTRHTAGSGWLLRQESPAVVTSKPVRLANSRHSSVITWQDHMKPSCTTALCFLNASPRFWRHYPVTTGSGIWSEQGEYQRRVLDIFREAQGAALSSRQIGAALVARQGLESTTAWNPPRPGIHHGHDRTDAEERHCRRASPGSHRHSDRRGP
jgi:hypothetical protein